MLNNEDKTKEIYTKRFPISGKDLQSIGNKWGKLPSLAKKYSRLSKKDLEVFESYKLPEGLGLRQYEFYHWKYYRLIYKVLNKTRFGKYKDIKDDLFQIAVIKLFRIYQEIITKHPQKYYKKRDKNGKEETIKDDPLFFNVNYILKIIENHLRNYITREYDKQNFASFNNKQLVKKDIKENKSLIEPYRTDEVEGVYKFDYNEKISSEYEKGITEEREFTGFTPEEVNILYQNNEFSELDKLSREEANFHYRKANNFSNTGLESPYHSISEIAYTIRKVLKGYYNISQTNIIVKIDMEKMFKSITNINKRRGFMLYCLYILTGPKRMKPGEDCPEKEREKSVSLREIGKYLGISQQAVNKNIEWVIDFLKREYEVLDDRKNKNHKKVVKKDLNCVYKYKK